jgi:mitogen-activated protein kinase kinase 1
MSNRRKPPPLEIASTPTGIRVSGECREILKDVHTVHPNELEILGDLGRGACSTVVRVLHKPTNRLYALKRITIPIECSDPEKRQIVNEIAAMSKLHHENLVPLVSGWCLSNQLNILMELVDGGSLAQLLSISHQIPEAALGRITWFCLQGLAHLRKEHILHRDLKPSNILISTTGRVQIADFGMARQLDGSIGQADSYRGTFCYMAPEKLHDAKYGYPSDVWSMGLVVYECALGRFPIAGAEDLLYWSVVDAVSHDIDVVLPGATPELVDFLRRCLKVEPEARDTVDQLCQHPWVVKYRADAANVEMLRWITEASEKRAKIERDLQSGIEKDNK